MLNKLVLIFLILSLLIFSSCSRCDEEDIAKEFDKRNQLLTQQKEDMRKSVSTTFFLGSFVFVLAGLVGPSIAEKGRAIITKKFNMSIPSQIKLARISYISFIFIILTISIADPNLKSVLPAILVLIGGTLYPFFKKVLPSIENNNPELRKSGISQIKTFTALIFIFYVVLSFLSPEGFGGIDLAIKF